MFSQQLVYSVGSVEEKLPCSPAHCRLVGINKMFSIDIGIVAGVRRTLIVQTRNRRGEPMQTGQVKVKAWVIKSRLEEKLCDGEVSNLDQGKYAVSLCVLNESLGKIHMPILQPMGSTLMEALLKS